MRDHAAGGREQVLHQVGADLPHRALGVGEADVAGVAALFDRRLVHAAGQHLADPEVDQHGLVHVQPGLCDQQGTVGLELVDVALRPLGGVQRLAVALVDLGAGEQVALLRRGPGEVALHHARLDAGAQHLHQRGGVVGVDDPLACDQRVGLLQRLGHRALAAGGQEGHRQLLLRGGLGLRPLRCQQVQHRVGAGRVDLGELQVAPLVEAAVGVGVVDLQVVAELVAGDVLADLGLQHPRVEHLVDDVLAQLVVQACLLDQLGEQPWRAADALALLTHADAGHARGFQDVADLGAFGHQVQQHPAEQSLLGGQLRAGDRVTPQRAALEHSLGGRQQVHRGGHHGRLVLTLDEPVDRFHVHLRQCLVQVDQPLVDLGPVLLGVRPEHLLGDDAPEVEADVGQRVAEGIGAALVVVLRVRVGDADGEGHRDARQHIWHRQAPRLRRRRGHDLEAGVLELELVAQRLQRGADLHLRAPLVGPLHGLQHALVHGGGRILDRLVDHRAVATLELGDLGVQLRRLVPVAVQHQVAGAAVEQRDDVALLQLHPGRVGAVVLQVVARLLHRTGQRVGDLLGALLLVAHVLPVDLLQAHLQQRVEIAVDPLAQVVASILLWGGQVVTEVGADRDQVVTDHHVLTERGVEADAGVLSHEPALPHRDPVADVKQIGLHQMAECGTDTGRQPVRVHLPEHLVRSGHVLVAVVLQPVAGVGLQHPTTTCRTEHDDRTHRLQVLQDPVQVRFLILREGLQIDHDDVVGRDPGGALLAGVHLGQPLQPVDPVEASVTRSLPVLEDPAGDVSVGAHHLLLVSQRQQGAGHVGGLGEAG